ncbi:MAG: zinc ribbon domain-containing protein [Microcoleaceae cyanobacterium]
MSREKSLKNSLIQDAKLSGIICVSVSPDLTSQNCANCGQTVEKSLSFRTHRKNLGMWETRAF